MSGPINQACVKPDDTGVDFYGVVPCWSISRMVWLTSYLEDGLLLRWVSIRLGTVLLKSSSALASGLKFTHLWVPAYP
jgi:hypothetical protein